LVTGSDGSDGFLGNFLEGVGMGDLASGFYVMVGGEVRGPFSRDQVLKAAKAGKLTAQSRVSPDMKTWVELGSVEGVEFPAPAPAPTPVEKPVFVPVAEPVVEPVQVQVVEPVELVDPGPEPVAVDSFASIDWSDLPAAAPVQQVKPPVPKFNPKPLSRRRSGHWLFDMNNLITPVLIKVLWILSIVVAVGSCVFVSVMVVGGVGVTTTLENAAFDRAIEKADRKLDELEKLKGMFESDDAINEARNEYLRIKAEAVAGKAGSSWNATKVIVISVAGIVLAHVLALLIIRIVLELAVVVFRCESHLKDLVQEVRSAS
jgi:hypothetical protein